MQKKWSDNEKGQLKELLSQNKTISQIADSMDRTYKSIEHAIKRNGFNDIGDSDCPQSKVEFSRESVNTAITTGTLESRPYTDEEMFTMFDIDSTMWTVTKKTINTWAKFFQTKLWLSRNKGVFEFRTIQEEFNQWLKANSPKVKANKYRFDINNRGRLLEINIADPHFDKLAWGKESGDNYDLKIARAVFLDAILKIIARAKLIGFERILFIIGNDLFNSEGARRTTSEGTPQDSDVRWKKSFTYVIDVLNKAINICKQHVPVDVLVVMGNHDEERTYYVGESVRALFYNDKNVTIDNNPKSRKFYKWGSNMISFLHGYLHSKKIKSENIPMIMAQEEPTMWANTIYRYCHLGHWHHNDASVYNFVKDQIGVTIQVLPSIAGTDGWHYDGGFIGNNHQAKGFLYDKNEGQIVEINYYAPKQFYLD